MFKLGLKRMVIKSYAKVYLALTFIFFNLISGNIAAQCSMCRAVVESDISGKGSGINNGIVYLMAFPYVLVVLIGVGLFLKLKKDSALTKNQ